MAAQPSFLEQVELGDSERAQRAERYPAGAAIRFDDLELHSRLPVLESLREREPVSFVPALGGWLVTAFEPARRLLADRDAFTVWAAPNLVRASLGVMMLTSDGAEHDRQRDPFDEPFRMRAVRERFELPIGDRIATLLDRLVPLGSCELGAAFAAPFAIGVASDALGLSLDDVPRIRGFYEAFAAAMSYDGDPEPQRRADAARAEFDALLAGEIARVRTRPDGSVTSAVVNSGAGGLGDDEVVAQLRVILFGAIETVESMVLNTTLLLLEHPEALAAVRAEPALAANAIEEAMRLIPPVAFIERWTSRPVRLGDVELEVGEFVGVSTLAANRDPDVFPDPGRFDVRRANARHHLAFSFGLHHCLGFNLARLQGTLAVQALVARLPALRIVDAPEPVGFAFRKPPVLHLAWEPG